MRIPLVFALLLLAAPTAFMQSAPVFRADTNAVVLQVTVTAPSGRDAGELQSEDFTVLEDGQPQPITLFSRAQEPLALSLMLDTSASMDESIGLAQRAAIEFTHRLRPNDVAEVVAFNNKVSVLQPFTPHLAELEQAIRQTSVSGTTALYSALYIALREFDTVRPTGGDLRRHAIVLLSDGEDTSSLMGFDEVFDLARRSNVSIYAIRLGDPPLPGIKTPKPGSAVLEQLAKATGGRAIFIDKAKDLLPIYSQIADELANQYTLAYAPPAMHRDGKWHDISVKVNRQSCAARTRSGYQASAAPAPQAGSR
jgi:Ca-activated chloride channel family protein